MPEFSESVLVLTDDADDRERASDGRSHYGVYLAARFHQITYGGDYADTMDFAIWAWQIATSPVMSPGYLRIRPDVAAITPHLTEDSGLVMRIDIPLRHHALAHRPARVDDWTRERNTWDDNPRWTRLAQPEPTGDRPTLLTTASLLVPVGDEHVIVGTARKPGPGLIRDAKRAVKALAARVNDHAHLVNALTGGTR
ncbi:hypothetical protein ACFVVX_01140 [Kitasatospora sp. NPDC058170]|uniref:hypothetical protein n=1 Tax=Kitasatospora sp. NPDC058170 TaxID=3346364 RepID=UPI0036D8FAF2